ncbi:MAG: restriction endonuclease subunit S [bacterium]
MEWLGQVPEHWGVNPLKRNLRLLTEKTDRREHPVALENIEGWTGRFIPTESEFQGDGVAFEPGDILFGKLRPYLAKAYRAESSGEAVGDFHVMRPQEEIDSRFSQYQILNRRFIDIVDGSTFGSKMPRASWEFVGGMRITTPPLAEQTAIADFLDQETVKINELITEQERLIELLKEKRQAVISHAVTKGLNPDAPMKDSGIEWLGQVPAHWEVKRTKYVVLKNEGIQMGPFGGMLLDLNDADTGFKVYGQENTISGDFSRGSRWLSEERFRSLINYHIEIGDLLLTRKGSLGNARLVQALPQPGMADSDTIRVRVDESLILPTFLALLFHEAGYIAQQLNLAKRGAILPGLNSEIIANIAVVLPSIAQQKDVMAYLDNELGKFNTLTTEAQKAIDLLQERRSALISAAVTGQIDVRTILQKAA